jgi:glycosyltransferase involved in cell wall biosynthesis
LIGIDYRPILGGRWTPWQANLWDYYRAIDFDIALCPLADTPFNACRTPVKALEAFALGIPVIASDATPYRSLVVDGVTGYLCRTPADWQTRMRELICDQEAREAMGAKAREVARGHTIQTLWRRWAAVYEEVSR